MDSSTAHPSHGGDDEVGVSMKMTAIGRMSGRANDHLLAPEQDGPICRWR